MKKSIFHNRLILSVSSVSILLALTAWSPPTGDHTVQIGSPNTISGSTASLTSPNQNVNISSFRGFIGGSNNVVGSSTNAAYHGVVSGNSNFGNAYWSFIGGKAQGDISMGQYQ